MRSDITSNAHQVAAELATHGNTAAVRAIGVTRNHGLLLLAAVRRRASLPRTGPPGPRIQTGNYVRSMAMQMTFLGGNPAAIVGTNAPQARRLEFGFTDTDSLGRRYSQPPYPHWDPGLLEIEPLFIAAIARLGALP